MILIIVAKRYRGFWL